MIISGEHVYDYLTLSPSMQRPTCFERGLPSQPSAPADQSNLMISKRGPFCAATRSLLFAPSRVYKKREKWEKMPPPNLMPVALHSSQMGVTDEMLQMLVFYFGVPTVSGCNLSVSLSKRRLCKSRVFPHLPSGISKSQCLC